ncbi:MAG TPA: hypothetical protein VHI71_10705 [Actinomycetota bacterium]|nr:hypothetical protein [Actinomycetota bacterium]
MRKLEATLLALALTLAACGGSAPEETTNDGIAALDEKAQGDAPDEVRGGKEKTKPSGTKPSGTKKGGTSKPSGRATPQAPAGGGGGTPAGGGGGGSGSQPQAAAIAPVPEGDHAYATQGQRTINGNTSDLPNTTTLSAGAPSGEVQRQARDLRDSDGNGVLTETDLHYRGDGVFLSYVKVTSRFQGGLTDVREFRLPRPVLIAPSGGGPGFAQSFTMQGSGTTAKVAIEAHRWENVAVGGRQVRTLLVQTNIRFSGALEGYQRSTSWVWPKHLLPLKEQVQMDVRNGPIRLQSSYQAQLKQLP